MKRSTILVGCTLAVCLFSLFAADQVLASANCSAECSRSDCNGSCEISSLSCSVSCVSVACSASCSEYGGGSCIWSVTVNCSPGGGHGGPEGQGSSQPGVSGWSFLSSGRDGVQELAASSVATGVLSVLEARERLEGHVVRATPAPQRQYVLDVRPKGR